MFHRQQLYTIYGLMALGREMIMHDAFNVIFWTSADICVEHDDLGWKNRSARYNCRFSAMSQALRVIFLGNNRTKRYNCRFWRAGCIRL